MWPPPSVWVFNEILKTESRVTLNPFQVLSVVGCIQSSSDAGLETPNQKVELVSTSVATEVCYFDAVRQFPQMGNAAFSPQRWIWCDPSLFHCCTQAMLGVCRCFWCGAVKARQRCWWKCQKGPSGLFSMGCTPAPQLYFPETTTAEQALHDLLPQTRADSTHNAEQELCLLVCSEEQKGTNA